MLLYVYIVKETKIMQQKAFYCPNAKLEGRRFSAVRDC